MKVMRDDKNEPYGEMAESDFEDEGPMTYTHSDEYFEDDLSLDELALEDAANDEDVTNYQDGPDGELSYPDDEFFHHDHDDDDDDDTATWAAHNYGYKLGFANGLRYNSLRKRLARLWDKIRHPVRKDVIPF